MALEPGALRPLPGTINRMRSGTVDLGGSVYFADFGGSGPAMVLVHGLGGSHCNWLAVGPSLSRHARVVAPDNIYLEMLAPLRPRYYSISSSPLTQERICSITVAVVDGPARSGRGTFQGVCSNYLGRQPESNVIYAFVKDTKSAFRLPEDPRAPMIMVGPEPGSPRSAGFSGSGRPSRRKARPSAHPFSFSAAVTRSRTSSTPTSCATSPPWASRGSTRASPGCRARGRPMSRIRSWTRGTRSGG